MLKKTSETTPTMASIVNAYSTSTQDGYSCDYINKVNTYSTDEQRVGTWIDGKPLYRKTIEASYIERAGFEDLLVSNVENGNMLFGWIQGSGGTKIGIPDGTKATTYLRRNGDLTLYSPNTATTIAYSITIQYTKTTD